MDSGQSTRTEPGASGWSCACPAEAARLPFSSPRNATTSLRGRWGSAKQLCGRPAPVPAGQAAPAPPHVDGPPAPGCSRCGVGSSPWVLQGRIRPGEQKGRIPAVSLWQRECCSPPAPDAFRRDGDSPMAVLAPTGERTAVPGAHPGRDPHQHRLPRPGRSAGPRRAWIRPSPAAAAAPSCIPRSPVGPSPRLAACIPTHQTFSPLALSAPASEKLIFIPFLPGCTHPLLSRAQGCTHSLTPSLPE